MVWDCAADRDRQLRLPAERSREREAGAAEREGLPPDLGRPRLVERKGFGYLVEALAMLAGDVELVLIGAGRCEGALKQPARGSCRRSRQVG